MTNEMLAQYANYALASAALVITVAMLCYAFYLSQAVPVREQAEVEAKVPATVGGGEGDATAEGGAEPAETSARARKTAGIAGTSIPDLLWLDPDDLAEDARRRDFTMNALYADPVSGEVLDWFGGLDDLSARRVRFIGEPLASPFSSAPTPTPAAAADAGKR